MGIQRFALYRDDKGVTRAGVQFAEAGAFVQYAEHTDAVAGLVRALEAYMALDHEDCTGSEYEGRCEACAARKQATAAIAAHKP